MTPTAALAEVVPGLCAICHGDRFVVQINDPVPCSCGDGLARSVTAAVADAARLSVDWLT